MYSQNTIVYKQSDHPQQVARDGERRGRREDERVRRERGGGDR